jgi:hypothetical protein
VGRCVGGWVGLVGVWASGRAATVMEAEASGLI